MRLRILVLLALAVTPALSQGLFLWEARGETGKAYLLGSVHLAKPELYPLAEGIEEAFRASDALVVEVDLNAVDETAMGAMALAAGVYGDGRRLSSEITPATLELLEAYLGGRGLPVRMFDSMRPWMAAMTVTLAEMQRLGYDPLLGIDRHFLAQAKETGLRVEQLETPEFQINLLSGFDDEMQDLFLHYTLKDMARTAEMIDGLMAAWLDGDADTVEQLLLAPDDPDPRAEPVYEKLFYQRNRDMVKKISALVDSGGVWFVVVGAGHMVGEKGLVELLGESYEVTQVQAKAAAVQASR